MPTVTTRELREELKRAREWIAVLGRINRQLMELVMEKNK